MEFGEPQHNWKSKTADIARQLWIAIRRGQRNPPKAKRFSLAGHERTARLTFQDIKSEWKLDDDAILLLIAAIGISAIITLILNETSLANPSCCKLGHLVFMPQCCPT